MPFTLNSVVPWGRSFDEYQRMFALSPDELAGNILACADGPASFNADATRCGSAVVSCDPLYRFSGSGIRDRIAAVYPEMLEQARRNFHDFVWQEFASVAELGAARMNAMEAFLADYEIGRAKGRYVDAALPLLPFGNETFDLALCSHFLFLYSEQFGEDFHTEAILEMARVAREVRVFPLTALGGTTSRHLPRVLSRLTASGLGVSRERVPYEFVRGANEMLRLRRIG